MLVPPKKGLIGQPQNLSAILLAEGVAAFFYVMFCLSNHFLQSLSLPPFLFVMPDLIRHPVSWFFSISGFRLKIRRNDNGCFLYYFKFAKSPSTIVISSGVSPYNSYTIPSICFSNELVSAAGDFCFFSRILSTSLTICNSTPFISNITKCFFTLLKVFWLILLVIILFDIQPRICNPRILLIHIFTPLLQPFEFQRIV
jgi:hypothetical protein